MKSSPTTTTVFLLLLLCLLHSSASTPTGFPTEALPTKSGYIPVNPKTNSAIFYLFYEAQNPTSPLAETPLLFWLQGRPGCSAMTGNFFELGPYRVVSSDGESISLEPNLGSWNRILGLVFVDTPIGTGFSIASTHEELPRNQLSIARHLYAAVTGFIESDPLFRNRPIYFAGQSYGGKYAPAIGYYILKQNQKLPVEKQVNLKGIALGNGLVDPLTQVKTHALNAYFSGLVNERQKAELEKLQQKSVELVKMGKWSEAADARFKVLDTLQNVTGFATLYDYTMRTHYQSILVDKFLSSAEVKRAIGANESTVYKECNNAVLAALNADVMKSVKYMVELLVKNIKVLLYQGHYDLRDGVLSTEAWVKTMRWEEIERFLMAERKIWKVRGVLAGYVQKWANLSNAVVLGTGHFVPKDQPLNSQAMIEDWILDQGIFASELERDVSSDSRASF
ncbi:hypothetical protein Tsubulata_027652 [Turnera subulata]|uniref:Serine carboxypeptidase-like 50 n=1 Tax=Turnera subulata TaxID=218843 RepID=A0A9Q0FSF9_9ROSI|nr:hypothetical protein Tsubulata_027652 [Turnera subulata]